MTMKLPFVRPKRTTRTVVDLTDAAAGTLALPLGVLRQIVNDTPEFSDTANAEFTIINGYLSPFGGGGNGAPALRSLVVEERR